jgi:ATP-dependent DNA ligase
VGWVSRADLSRWDEILIQSRDKSLNRYFPELIESLSSQLPAQCVLDGEIVLAKNDGLDFEELQLRIHPAASRVKLSLAPTAAIFKFPPAI